MTLLFAHAISFLHCNTEVTCHRGTVHTTWKTTPSHLAHLLTCPTLTQGLQSPASPAARSARLSQDKQAPSLLTSAPFALPSPQDICRPLQDPTSRDSSLKALLSLCPPQPLTGGPPVGQVHGHVSNCLQPPAWSPTSSLHGTCPCHGPPPDKPCGHSPQPSPLPVTYTACG